MIVRCKKLCKWKCLAVLSIYALGIAFSQPRVKLGNDVLMEKRLDVLKNRRVGLVINHTARLSPGEFLVDALIAKGINIVVLFGPEHGIRGEAAAGEKVSDSKDEKTSIPVFSLYGKTRKPTAEMLANVDVLVYDIQDVGVRFYTYISTMGLCMEAAAEKRIPFIVLDRPNPLGGVKIDGPIIEDSLKSFVGMYSIPVVYGLTCGELALMINGEGWLTNRVKCKLTVIKMEGWKRTMTWDDTGLEWIPPSPNIKTSHAALAYPATCFIEATNLSEGRGTEKPFQFVGAPRSARAESAFTSLHRVLSSTRETGLRSRVVSFIPSSSKHKDKECVGVEFSVEDWSSFSPVATGVFVLRQLNAIYPLFEIQERSFLRLIGARKCLELLRSDDGVSEIASRWSDSVSRFRSRSKKYYLYR